jgi:hypothetical protein
MAIFNHLGQPVKTIMQDYKPAGIYRERIDLSQLPAGIYFLRMKCGQDTITRKLIKL